MTHSDREEAKLARIKERILEALAGKPAGLMKTELYQDVFGKNYPAARIGKAVDALAAEGKVTVTSERRAVVTNRNVTVVKLATA